jgi:cation diffusion facilitator CzcD-associated flavoprotein CzcO
MTSVIKSVAVIGAGPGGIASVNELSHTSLTGNSTLEQNIKPENPAFDKIVCFEQNDTIGGVWNFFETPDPSLPPLDILQTKNFGDPNNIYENSLLNISNDDLKNKTIDNPFVRNSNKIGDDELRWTKNAAYENLFTNVPEQFMRFSYTPYENKSKGRFLEPLISLNDVRKYLLNIVDKYELKEYFRFNSSVELIEKNEKTKKWRITVREKLRFSIIEKWYTEEFDAIVIANGHCNVPFIPEIENISEFVSKYPDIIKHSKSFRDVTNYKNGNVLLCGSGTSSADLAQYLSPVVKSITISQKSQSIYPWIKECFEKSPEIKFKPRIKKLLSNSKSVEFNDGTIDQFDHIILSTGYHYHFPFLPNDKEYIKIFNNNNTQVNKIGNLYLYTFSTKDNTLATVGIPTTGFMFHTIEYGAAAIAGVFSGNKKLPSIDEQIKWDYNRTNRKDPEVPHRFQGFLNEKVNEQLWDPLFQFAPIGRSCPLKKDNMDVNDVNNSDSALIKAFMALKSGNYNAEDLLK